MPKKPKRDDSWDQVSPLFAMLANDEKINETQRRTNRIVWVFVSAVALLVGAWSLAECLWGAAFLRVVNIVAQIGGAAILVGIGVLWCLAFFQKDKR